MGHQLTIPLADEEATCRLGEALALLLRPGDCLTLSGPLGAGKTTLARAIVRALCADDGLEVPSPTYALVQPYEGEGFRFPVLHTDFYRLKDPDEADELGLDDGLASGALIIEWPEHGPQRFRQTGFHLRLQGTQDRLAHIDASDEGADKRLRRMQELRDFLDSAGFARARRAFLQGDASPRAYETIRLAGKAPLVLLNADARPDQAVSPERKAYMARAHLVPNEDIGPVIAIMSELARHGFSAPAIGAFSRQARAVVMEHLGTDYVAAAGVPVAERYHAAIDVLLAMHAIDWPDIARGPHDIAHRLPRYSQAAMLTEVELFLDKYLGGRMGHAVTVEERNRFLALWRPLFDKLDAGPRTWTLFDFHSPNLHWLADRQGIKRIGIIDSQDARLGPLAYDVVSLVQDARLDMPSALQADLLAHYVAGRKSLDISFDEERFHDSFSICGAQRATRILGVFARLAAQDGKPAYLRHLPRIRAFLAACLRNPVLKDLRQWFEMNAPSALSPDVGLEVPA